MIINGGIENLILYRYEVHNSYNYIQNTTIRLLYIKFVTPLTKVQASWGRLDFVMNN